MYGYVFIQSAAYFCPILTIWSKDFIQNPRYKMSRKSAQWERVVCAMRTDKHGGANSRFSQAFCTGG